MKKLLAIFAALLFAAAPARADTFMAAFEEIPLLSGLTEEPPLSFDTDAVRIIEEFVHGPISAAEFVRFYKATLAQLGWELKSESDSRLLFRRDDEALEIRVRSRDPFVASFTLSPWGK